MLNRVFIGFSGLLCLTLLPSAQFQAQASDSQTQRGEQEVKVLVPPFENMSNAKAMIDYEVGTSNDPDHPKKRVFHIDRYTEAPRSVLEDLLVGIEGVKVVERQRVDQLLLESQFSHLSGLVDTEKAVKLGKMLGANVLVMGTIEDVRTENKNFSGYGIRTENAKVIASIRLRVVDIETGHETYSNRIKGSATYMKSQFGGVSSSDVAYEVIESALEQLKEDQNFRQAIFAAQLARNKSSVATEDQAVEFAPKPDNCDLEIDGNYVGGTPLKRPLAAGKPVKVRISKAGFVAWEKTIMPEPGLRITPELAQDKANLGEQQK